MTCKRCEALGPQVNELTRRNCGFNNEGRFTTDNYLCGTIQSLRDIHTPHHITYHCDHQVQTYRVESDTVGYGVINLVIYKERGRALDLRWAFGEKPQDEGDAIILTGLTVTLTELETLLEEGAFVNER